MSRYVDQMPAEEPVGRCVVLPGTGYVPDAPLLFLVGQLALAHGWAVRQVWWTPPDIEDGAEAAWVAGELDAALAEPFDGVGDRTLVVGKSLGTAGAARAAELKLPAIWLTPLLTYSDLAAPLLRYPTAQLVVIGEGDRYLDRDVLGVLPGRHALVPGDHAMLVPGEPFATWQAHREVMAAVDGWLAQL
ncbi:hypothetical protein [Nocardioides acrostichi]|uniref:Alpha/beta hydrolase n=1 Tax=Nocardioides acrostichi TaxID=2784339 RepID=A0A930YB20_9ACTN|nr:hypothetical protein [Nocardioides acrostichi]MBF4160074.1 hypothetical protein [Nocardioides acrostichi]